MRSGFYEGEDPMVISDQAIGIDQPQFEKPCHPDAVILELPPVSGSIIVKDSIYRCLAERRSRRKFSKEPLSLEELSFLLWATQGVQSLVPAYHRTGQITLRPVPSGGGRHAFETYVIVNRVQNSSAGLHRYLPVSHRLEIIFDSETFAGRFPKETHWTAELRNAAAAFMWACVPYRGEWRYHREAHRIMLLDAGHIGQNFYLAAESIGCGAYVVGGYDQHGLDALLGIDGQDEFLVYYGLVGKLPAE